MTRSVRMADLSWQDYARRIAEEQPVLFLPVGAIEQHGQHLPMDCDVVIPDALAVRAAEWIGGLVARRSSMATSRSRASAAAIISPARPVSTARR